MADEGRWRGNVVTRDALAYIAFGGVVLLALYALICMCSGRFPEESGQAVPRDDVVWIGAERYHERAGTESAA